jgi:deoxyribonuclease V
MEEKEIADRFGLNIEELKRDQLKLAKNLEIKDRIDFDGDLKIAAIDNLIINNQIISAVIVCNKEFEVLEEQYFLDKLRFPYLHEFRSYRELPAMVEAFSKLDEKPDLVLIHGHGIDHPRLGLASHFSIITGIPTIGVSDSVFEGNETKDDFVLRAGKKVGRVFLSKPGSTPIYVSPGNLITIDSSLLVCKKLIKLPHKLPEPLYLAHKYAKSVREELKI